jgi:hypothetical protein
MSEKDFLEAFAEEVWVVCSIVSGRVLLVLVLEL